MLDVDALSKPQFGQPAALAVSRLRPDLLQSWLLRGTLTLADQNPGRGKSRLYSAIDISGRLAPMRRCADLKLALEKSTRIADVAVHELTAKGAIDWDLMIVLRPGLFPEKPAPGTIAIADTELQTYLGDPRDMRVSTFTEWFEMTHRRRTKLRLAEVAEAEARNKARLQAVINRSVSGEEIAPDLPPSASSDPRPIDPERREALARIGIHAEPAILFPLGEIVNGALAQLRALAERDNAAAATKGRGKR